LIEVYVDHEGTKLTLLKGEDIDVLVHDKKVTLKEGETTNA
jgi:Glycosyl hydrolase family 65, C-terminal domain.